MEYLFNETITLLEPTMVSVTKVATARQLPITVNLELPIGTYMKGVNDIADIPEWIGEPINVDGVIINPEWPSQVDSKLTDLETRIEAIEGV